MHYYIIHIPGRGKNKNNSATETGSHSTSNVRIHGNYTQESLEMLSYNF